MHDALVHALQLSLSADAAKTGAPAAIVVRMNLDQLATLAGCGQTDGGIRVPAPAALAMAQHNRRLLAPRDARKELKHLRRNRTERQRPWPAAARPTALPAPPSPTPRRRPRTTTGSPHCATRKRNSNSSGATGPHRGTNVWHCSPPTEDARTPTATKTPDTAKPTTPTSLGQQAD